MRRSLGRRPQWLSVVLYALFLLGSLGPAQAEPEQRIVSLNPSLTAILVAIGAGDRLVGVDDFSARSQPAVAHLPRVGGLYNTSLESIAALSPDLVVLVPSAEQRDLRARLAEFDVDVLELDPVGFDDVLETIETLGSRAGRAAPARQRVAEIRRVRRVVEAARLPSTRGVLVLQRDPLFVVGRGSFVDDMLRSVGVENLAAVFDEPYPRVSREWLIDVAPDTLLDSSQSEGDAHDYWSKWPSIPAVRKNRVVTLPRGLATLPGPRLDLALLVLAEAVHGKEAIAQLMNAAASEPGEVADPKTEPRDAVE